MEWLRASIGLSLASWLASHQQEDLERADRWGIFVGEWAPTRLAVRGGRTAP